MATTEIEFSPVQLKAAKGAVMAATEAAGGSSLEQVKAVAEELSAG